MDYGGNALAWALGKPRNDKGHHSLMLPSMLLEGCLKGPCTCQEKCELWVCRQGDPMEGWT